MTRQSVLAAVRAHLYPTRDGHRVTSLELFFDLVFVYAITNISVLVEHRVEGRTVVEAAVVLSLVWFAWCAYAWLGNQARADEGLLRVALVVAVAGMFFVAISIPYVFTDGTRAAGVLVAGYTVVRLVHLAVYFLAAGDDLRLRSVVLSMFGVFMVVLVPLVVGVLADSHARLWWWAAAVLIDQLGVYFVRSSRWRLNSASHFAERFGNIVLIAIGESLIGLGQAVSRADLTWSQAGYLICGLSVSVCLWWTYFDVVAPMAERTLHRAQGLDRARLARDSFTYLHLPILFGVESTSLGLALIIEGEGEHVVSGRLFLCVGLAIYLFSMSALRRRNVGGFNRPRLVATAVFLALAAATVGVEGGGGWVLSAAALLFVALVAFETVFFREARRRLRHPDDEADPPDSPAPGASPAPAGESRSEVLP